MRVTGFYGEGTVEEQATRLLALLDYGLSHENNLSDLLKTYRALDRSRGAMGSGTGVPPARIVQPTHGETPVPLRTFLVPEGRLETSPRF